MKLGMCVHPMVIQKRFFDLSSHTFSWKSARRSKLCCVICRQPSRVERQMSPFWGISKIRNIYQVYLIYQDLSPPCLESAFGQSWYIITSIRSSARIEYKVENTTVVPQCFNTCPFLIYVSYTFQNAEWLKFLKIVFNYFPLVGAL